MVELYKKKAIRINKKTFAIVVNIGKYYPKLCHNVLYNLTKNYACK